MQLNCPRPMHRYTFTVIDKDNGMPERVVNSLMSPRELQSVSATGFAIVRGLLTVDQVQSFGDCVDRVRARRYRGNTRDTYRSGRYGGQYLRDLHAHDRDAWPLLMSTPIVDTVRSLLGPRIVMRSYSARVTYPGSLAATIWHADQRAGVMPEPPWFTRARSVTVLVYLDKADSCSGQTSLVPRSHDRKELPVEKGDPPDAITVDAEPGDALIFDGGLWHRAGPNGPDGWLRRVLNLQFAPSWTRLANFEAIADNALVRELADRARLTDRIDDLELLGQGGYM